MDFPKSFIRAGKAMCSLTEFVPAPYFRKTFSIKSIKDLKNIEKADITICGLGFYELYLNGQNITKGLLAPYISNPDDLVYYDKYDIQPYLRKGENVIGICLGNGLQNAFGAYCWDFQNAKWRSAPQFALRCAIEFAEGIEPILIESDETFKTAPSPILFDDRHCGEYYDARLEIPGWNEPGFNDKKWKTAEEAPMPRGDAKLCDAEPIVKIREIKPISITEEETGFRYDFGENMAGLSRLRIISNKPGQQVDLVHGEAIIDGKLHMRNIKFDENDYVQKDIYYCKGTGEPEEYMPHFTYHGFRYVLVRGITKEQATPDLLTYVIFNSDLEERGGFHCSDEIVNKLQEATRRSDLSNFYYYPVDCCQREKNGWTADAALSTEHMLLNLSVGNSYKEWMRNIAKAQNDAGALPGIIPTGGWGFAWGNGPAWDNVIVYLPYYTYKYTGDKEVLEIAAPTVWRYLNYIIGRADERGLVEIGLGDWCPVGNIEDRYISPLIFTDSVLTMDIAEKAAFIFENLGLPLQSKFASELAARTKAAVRKYLIDTDKMLALGNCQTSQAMALFYNIFEGGERAKAFENLVEIIARDDDHINLGVLGARVIFHVLTAFGRSDLAYKMIARTDFPSYGNWITRGATTLWETHQPEGGRVLSLNHHFWGDISGWFIQALAGIRYNPNNNDFAEVEIRPSFVPQLDDASGFHICSLGKISSAWRRVEDGIELTVEIPAGMKGMILLEDRWIFAEDGKAWKPAASGTYLLRRK